MRTGILFVVSGPAGSGKGTVVKQLVEKYNDVKLSVSATTRAPRQGEVHGREYFFITKEEFEKRISNGEMLEYNHFTGNGNYYGTPKKEVEEALNEGNDIILEIEVNGGMNVKKQFPNAVTIMLTPPNGEELERRLIARNTESPEEIRKRLETAQRELEYLSSYDYAVVNETGKSCECAELIYTIIKAERQKTIYTKSIRNLFK